jgi:hypothetical protein
VLSLLIFLRCESAFSAESEHTAGCVFQASQFLRRAKSASLKFPRVLLWRSTHPLFIQFLPSVLSFQELGARPVLTVRALFHVRLVWLSLARIVQSPVSIVVQDRPACLVHSGHSLSVCLDFQFLVPAKQGDGGPAVHESLTLLLSFFCKVLVCESLQRNPGIALESPD